MTSRTEHLIDAYYLALKSADKDRLAGLLSPDILVSYYGPEGLFPWQGEWQGRARFFEFLDAVANNLTIDSVTPLQRIFADSTAVIVLNGKWTIKETGVKVEATVANIFSFQAEKITRYQVFTDTAAIGLGIGALTQIVT